LEKIKLGQKIRLIRVKQNLSQKEFGLIFGVNQKSVSQWEQDLSRPNLDILVSMSTRFQVNLDTLLKGDGKLEFEKEPEHDEKT